jgi:hypothetical protein
MKSIIRYFLHIEHTNFKAFFALYFVTVIIAAAFIFSEGESVISNIVKAIIWPLYLISKLG